MHPAVALTLFLAGLGFAQDLPIDDYEDIVATVVADAPPFGQSLVTATPTYNQASAISEATADAISQASEAVVATATTLERRVAVCTARPFNGPQVTEPADSDSAFLGYQPFADTANGAAQPAAWPAEYKLVDGYVNLHGSGQSTSYLTYTAQIEGYNLAQCAARCDSIVGCVSFNIFYERDPLIIFPDTQTPNSQYCPADHNSPSATLIKCAFYNKPIKPSEAINVGQYQGSDFHLVIAGSNAYAKTAPRLVGYSNPTSFGNAAINAPAPVDKNGYMRVQTFGTDVPLDPKVCADSCAAQSDYNSRHGGPKCIFFNAYLLYKNGQNPVFTCTYYSVVYDKSYAKNVGQYNSKGDHFTIGSSYGYTLIQ
ncbi:hypothetical protein GE09DRAFT_1286908 [Coniochaeta sp. 2T2.1]|nr:hypothetical protein GE09DRAFT_1286908 [Coniochaeta sp. 2T2.1]